MQTGDEERVAVRQEILYLLGQQMDALDSPLGLTDARLSECYERQARVQELREKLQALSNSECGVGTVRNEAAETLRRVPWAAPLPRYTQAAPDPLRSIRRRPFQAGDGACCNPPRPACCRVQYSSGGSIPFDRDQCSSRPLKGSSHFLGKTGQISQITWVLQGIQPSRISGSHDLIAADRSARSASAPKFGEGFS